MKKKITLLLCVAFIAIATIFFMSPSQTEEELFFRVFGISPPKELVELTAKYARIGVMDKAILITFKADHNCIMTLLNQHNFAPEQDVAQYVEDDADALTFWNHYFAGYAHYGDPDIWKRPAMCKPYLWRWKDPSSSQCTLLLWIEQTQQTYVLWTLG